MSFRDFGHRNFSQAPPGGYPLPERHLPNNRIYEGNIPKPARPTMGRFVLDKSVEHEQITEEQVETTPELFEGHKLGNEDLPIHAFREIIKDSVKNNPVTIVVSGTGAGKSTQMPQLLLEARYRKTTITQPRRIATYGVASRIEEEIGNKLGASRASELVAYQTAEKNTVTPKSRIIAQTDGIEAIRHLNNDAIEEDEVHIIDEVHEWNTNIEISIALVKKRVKENPNLRFVITTATINAEEVSQYFADVVEKKPPIINVPGRAYKIEEIEKPDSTVAAEIMESILKYPNKSMLVFLPGKREISDTMDKIYSQLSRSARKNVMILPLHAKLTKEQQDMVKVPFNGTKIILSTNVAQTSVTIPDADIVIDCGEERRVELDSEGVEGLGKHVISQADIIQRKGRTGRVSDGIYIRTRYDANSEYKQFYELREYPIPEILRTDIDRTTLRTAAVGIDLNELDLFHPLDPSVIDRSRDSLRTLGALDEYDNITTSGLLMNRYPVKPSSGRMLVESLRHSPQVQSYIAAITAAIEVGGLPYFAPEAGREWQQFTDETSSDLLAQLDIFIAIQNMPESLLSEYDLDVQNVKRAQELYQKITYLSQSYTGELVPPNLEEKEKIKECVYSGMLNFLYRHQGRGFFIRAGEDKTETPREISNRSIVSKGDLVIGSPYRVEFMKSGKQEEKHIIEQVTVVDNVAALGRAAMHLCRLVPDKISWRGDNRPVEVMKKMLFDIELGSVERDARPSPALRQAIIDKSISDSPGPVQRRLRVIKKQLEELQHLSKVKIPQLQHETIVKLVNEAAPQDLTELGALDLYLGYRVKALGFDDINSFVTPEERRLIIKNAPPEIVTTSGELLPVIYRNGQPTVRHYDPSVIVELDKEIYLDDGRQVLFVHHKDGRSKAFTIAELREHLTYVLQTA